MRVLCHVLFWFAVALLYYLNYKRIAPDLIWIFLPKDMFVVMVMFYGTTSFVVSNWLLKGKWLLTLLWVAFGYVLWAAATYIVCLIIVNHFPTSGRYLTFFFNLILSDGPLGLIHPEKIPVLILDYVLLVSLPLSPKLMKSLMEQGYQAAKLEQQNLQLELDFLKSQVSPHFLFNTLTNIYQMSKQQDAGTPEIIFRLSDLMRYILYESKQEMTALQKEIGFLRNYIELARIRYEEDLPLTVSIDEPDEPYTIVPLILIPFLENAFKHGPDRSLHNAWVTVELYVRNDVLTFCVANGINGNADRPANGGIGLENARRRLARYYPQAHTLDIEEQADSYQVKLTMDLK